MDTSKSKTGSAQPSEGGEIITNENEKSEEKRSTGILKEIFWGTVYAFLGYVLGMGVLPFGARPLGAAFLCASEKRVFYIYAGLCLGAWNSELRIPLLCVYSAVMLVRIVSRLAFDSPWKDSGEAKNKTLAEAYPFIFKEHLSLRMSSACVAAFAIGVYKLIRGGFLYYDLYGTILSTVTAPIAVLLFSGAFCRYRIKKGSSSLIYRYLSGLLSLSFAAIWALGDQKVYGISLAVFGAMFVTLYVTRKHGVIAGAVAGTVCGLAVSVELAPMFVFAALSAGITFSVSAALAGASAFSSGLAWGVYVKGIGILNGTLSALIASSILFTVVDKLYLSERKSRADGSLSEADAKTKKRANAESEASEAVSRCEVLDTEALDGIRLSATNSYIKELCESFSSLSEVFYGLSKRMRTPTASDLRQICDNAFESSCTGCAQRETCWGERYRLTSEEVGRICAALHKNGCVGYTDADTSLTERCCRISDILDEINHNAALHQKQIIQGDRTEVFALDYEALASLLSVSMSEKEIEYQINEEASAKLCAALGASTDFVRGACVYGDRRRKIAVLGTDSEKLFEERELISNEIKSTCGIEIDNGKIRVSGKNCLELFEREMISVSFAQRVVCADDEDQYCGDTVGTLKNSDGRFYSFISDGMGSGREAALTSGISGMFLKRLLGSSNSCKTTLDMLNGFLRNRVSGSIHECSATIDLLELDLMKSHASFYKCGAAPTYVFRDGSLFKIRSHTVPVGIIKEPDMRKIGFDVSVGDVIVMVSDGVTQGKEECPWLFDLLRSQGEDVSIERLADLVVKYAKGEGCSDDISVLIVKIA